MTVTFSVTQTSLFFTLYLCRTYWCCCCLVFALFVLVVLVKITEKGRIVVQKEVEINTTCAGELLMFHVYWLPHWNELLLEWFQMREKAAGKRGLGKWQSYKTRTNCDNIINWTPLKVERKYRDRTWWIEYVRGGGEKAARTEDFLLLILGTNFVLSVHLFLLLIWIFSLFTSFPS